MRWILIFLLSLTLVGPILAQTGTELAGQAEAAQKEGEAEKARALWSLAAETLAKEGNEGGRAYCLFHRATLEYDAEEYETALATLHVAEQIYIDLERDDGIALVLLQKGSALSALNRRAEAESVYRRSLEAARRHGDPDRVAQILERIAKSLDTRHRWNEAYDAYRLLMDHQIAQGQLLKANDTLSTLGAVRQVQTRHEEALDHYRTALEVYLNNDRPAEAAEVLDRISRLLLSRYDWDGAEANLHRAIEFHISQGNREREAIARANLGYAFENQDEFEQAAEQYQKSAALFTELKNPSQVRVVQKQQIKALALSGKDAEAKQSLQLLYAQEPMAAGKLCLELGWDELAESYFQTVLETTQEPGERARLLNQLGMLAAGRTELLEAREFFVQSLDLARQADSDELAASVLNNLGENYQSQGLYREAEPYYREALEHFQKVGSLSGRAYALSNLGTLAFAQGEYVEALEYLNQANTLALKPETFTGPHALMGTVLNALGLVHQFLGRTEEAERLYLEAIAARRAVNDLRGEIVTLNNLAAMYSERRDYKGAIRIYNLALELSDRNNDPSHLAQIYNNLGLAAVALGQKEDARGYYDQALELYRTQRIRDGEAITLDNLGHLAATPQEAASLHGQAVAILEQIGNRQSLATALLNLGQSQADMGKRDDAIATLTRSVDLLDEMSLALSPNDKTAFLGKNVQAYQTLVRLLVESDRDEEAFRVNERARARALLELLGGRSVPIGQVPEELASREERLRARIRELLAAPVSESNQVRLSSLKEEYGFLLDEIARVDPGRAGLRRFEAPDTQKLSKNLGKKRAILEYVVQQDRTYIFVVANNEVQTVRVEIGNEEILRLLGKWRRSLPRGGDSELSQSLGRGLVEPVLPMLEGVEELVVVPHQSLHYLPFSAIEVAGKPLIEQYRLSRIPSASAWLLSQEQQLRKGPFAAAALGNLSIGPAHSEEITRGSTFSPLPGTLEEVSALVNLFPGSTQLIEKQLTSAELRKVGTESGALHVATHGVFDPEYPLFSGLVTSDGMVTVADILGWERTPDLVVLSACETALGDLGEGDDIVGLSRAFQAGGTRCLVATLWPVSDESTSLWMTSFYNALKNKQTTAEASAGATLALRERYPSPYYWAPFVVIGDGETRIEFE